MLQDPDVFSMTIQDEHTSRFVLLHMAAQAPQVPLALARSGTLSKLIAWGEANCARATTDAVGLTSTDTDFQAWLYMTRPQLPLHQLKAWCAMAPWMQDVRGTLNCILGVIRQACAGTTSTAALDALGQAHMGTKKYWQRMQAEVAAPLADALAAEGGDDAEALQVQVDVAQALTTRPCAHPGCCTVVGPSEAAAPRGKRCSNCPRLVRYCGAACQKADWKAHKAACAELQRRRA